MSLQETLSGLLGLTQDELLEVQKHITLLLPQAEHRQDDDWLLAGVIAVLKEKGLGDTIPTYFKIKNQKSYHGYARKSERLRGMLLSKCGALRRTEHYALGHMAASLLFDYLAEESRALGLWGMLGSIDVLPQAIDDAFPGYLESGLLGMLLRPTPPKELYGLAGEA